MRVERPDYETFEPGKYPTPEQFDRVEIKQDGWFSCLVLEGTEWNLYSRTSRNIGSGTFTTPIARTVLYGEYIYGTEWAKDRPHLYGQIHLFGADTIYGRELLVETHEMGRRLIANFLKAHRDIDIIQKCVLVEDYPVEQCAALWESHVIGQDCEGFVFKHSKHPWGRDFGRMKRAVTMDYVCTGFDDSDSDSYAGVGVANIIGALYKDGKLEDTCKVSGLDEEQRVEFYNHPEKYIGKVFESHGKKISKRGALRHPNFSRWREDKLPEECVWPPKGANHG